MTDPKLGPDPTLAALLDELIDAAQESVRTGGVKWTSAVAELRATILFRFGGTVCVDAGVLQVLMTPDDYTSDSYVRAFRIGMQALAPTDTEAAAKEGDGDGPR